MPVLSPCAQIIFGYFLPEAAGSVKGWFSASVNGFK